MNLVTQPAPHRSLFHSRLLCPGLILLASFFAPVLTHAVPAKKKPPADFVHVELKRFGEYLKYHREPEYPLEARQAHVGGSGIFQVNFGPDGKVKDIAVLQSTGYIVLDHACLWTLVHWQARHPGEIQAVRVPIRFTMGR